MGLLVDRAYDFGVNTDAFVRALSQYTIQRSKRFALFGDANYANALMVELNAVLIAEKSSLSCDALEGDESVKYT